MSEEWSISAGHMPGTLVSILVGLVVGVSIYEAIVAFRHRSDGPRKIAFAILGLRLLALVGLVAIAFEIGLVMEAVSPSGQRVVVLVDSSKSMALADAAEEGGEVHARHARAEELWERSTAARAEWAQQGLELDVRSFAVDSSPWPGEDRESLSFEPKGPASDLARALLELGDADARQARPLAGVVVISDGLVLRDTAGKAHLDTVAKNLEVPLTTAAVGAPFITDIGFGDLHAGEFAFVENVTEFEIEIVAHGLAGKSTHVDLFRDGEKVASTPLTVPADGVIRRVDFELAPDRIGQFVYEFRIRPLDGEATLENNRRAFVVKVLRDKVRVLHVAGRPDWDVRALRTLLKRDPNVELLSYYILRDFEDIDRADESAELSLIQFPTDELFNEELGGFDMVVLHNFDASRHGRYHQNFARYVAEGGSVVVIGGDMGLASGEYAERSFARMLPVDTRRPTGLDKDPFRPELTTAGRRHPITAWLAESGLGWEALPELDSFNPTSLAPNGAEISATALLVHPKQKGPDGKPAPLLAVAEPGKGRSLTLATGATWRLGFAPDLSLIDGARPYDLLWLGAMRWLLRDKSSERLILETARPSTIVGEPVELRARTLSASYAAEPEVEVEWEVRSLDETEQRKITDGRWISDGLGRAVAIITDLPIGAYEATARRVTEDPETANEARRVFLVDAPSRELASVDADPGTALLSQLAEQTEGLALVALDGDSLPVSLPLAEPKPGEGRRVDSRQDIPLWDGWLALALLALALPGEWLLRRRHGQA